MGLLAPLILLLTIWLIATGRLQRMTLRDGAALGLALVGATLMTHGAPLVGGGSLAVATLYGAYRLRRLKPRRPAPAPARAPAEDAALSEARALLGLDASADERAIRAAHRRLIAKNHPDAGGTQALAEKINDARALLLRHLVENKRSHPSPSGSSQESAGI